MGWKTLDEMELEGRRVLVRVDINVPVEDGRITDATRIERTAPTIRDILARGGRPILLAHFARPNGRRVPEMSLQIAVPALATAVGAPVRFAGDCIGPEAEAAAAALPAGDVLLLENTRFHPGEEKNDPAFAAALARLGEVYVNDAFSAAHRAHASTEGVARLLPNCAGRLMAEELRALERVLGQPEHPVMAVVGGSKVSSKLDLLGNLIPRVDRIAIGGGMANTFLAAQGIAVGRSLCEHELVETAREIMGRAAEAGCELVLPSDAVVARELREGVTTRIVDVESCPADMMILDAGPRSVEALILRMETARTLLWNGPLGAFEVRPFNAATDAAALKAAELTRAGRLLSLAGGGDTVAALNASGAAAGFTYVSTAGGAFLEWLEGKTLPGVAAIGG
jgi:phosphoglycerate kinase